MSAGLREYLLALIACALLTALCMALLPQGGVRRAGGFVCGLLLLLCTIRPVLRLDSGALAQAVSRAAMQAEAARTGVEVRNRTLVAAIIKENCEAYILDKAAELGVAVTADVTVAGEDTYPYPAAVRLCGDAAPQQQLALTRWIAASLAIPEEAQTWTNDQIRRSG